MIEGISSGHSILSTLYFYIISDIKIAAIFMYSIQWQENILQHVLLLILLYNSSKKAKLI